jgi:hypothetical protein|tara:strand:+ start:418 stop:624 length:207 start_codon:yes stop_codon:yes gene_type:complete
MNKNKILKSDIDYLIIDLIHTHFNALSFKGKPAILTSNQYDVIVKMAEEVYYKSFISESPYYNEDIRN